MHVAVRPRNVAEKEKSASSMAGGITMFFFTTTTARNRVHRSLQPPTPRKVDQISASSIKYDSVKFERKEFRTAVQS